MGGRATVSDLPAGKGKDLVAAKAWLAEAARVAKSFNYLDHERLATLGRFADLAGAVSAAKDDLARFDAVRCASGLSATSP